MQQVLLPKAFHLPSKSISRMTTLPFLLDLQFLGFFLVYYSTVAFLWRFGKRGTVKGRIRNVSMIPTSPGSRQDKRGETGYIPRHVQGLCFVTEGLALLFQAALPHVGCISKLPTVYPFSRKSHSSIQVLSNCYGT